MTIPFRRLALLALATAIAVPALAGNIEIGPPRYWYLEGATYTVDLNVTETFTDKVTVSYWAAYPTIGFGDEPLTLSINAGVKQATFALKMPYPPMYAGGYDGTVYIAYSQPGSDAVIVKSDTFNVRQDEPYWMFDMITIKEPAVRTPIDVDFRINRPTTAPLTSAVRSRDATARNGFDYTFEPIQFTFAPGQTEGKVTVWIEADNIAEEAETFSIYGGSGTSYGGQITIDETPKTASLDPSSLVVMAGDPFALRLSLSEPLPWSHRVELVSSDLNIIDPLGDEWMWVGGAPLVHSIDFLARAAGEATFSVQFPESTGIAAPAATIQVFGGELRGPAERVTVRRGETRDVPFVFEPAPPITLDLGTQSSTDAISLPAGFSVSVSGQGALPVTGIALGDSSVTVVNGFGRQLAWIEVTVTPAVGFADLAPTTGSAAGGTRVTLTGEDFVEVCTVTFGNAAPVDATIVNQTTLSVVTPAHAAGIVAVSVTCGDQTVKLPGVFTFNAAGRTRSVRH